MSLETSPKLSQRLLAYLETLTGVRPIWTPLPEKALPLFLRNRYELGTLMLFGQPHRFALEKPGSGFDSPSGYEKESEVLREKLGGPVVLGIAALPSFARNRLVHLGVPFVVPGSQLFLPPVLVDLRERFAAGKKRGAHQLTPAAQCVLLYHLQRTPLGGLSLGEIARKVGYTPMMLSKVKSEFVAAGLAEAHGEGRSIMLRFMDSRRGLWDRALPILTSPVKKTLQTDESSEGLPALRAGLTALSELTRIEDDSRRTLAMDSAAVRKALESGDIRACPDWSQSIQKMECWSYDPTLLGDADFVDPLSLYLSLRESPDERIQQQLSILIEEFPW